MREPRVTGPAIRPFVSTDIEFALAQTQREGWDATAELFEVCLALAPEGCFIAEIGGRPVGMVTTTRHKRTAWIGNLIVVPEHRRRGIGERLMRRAMEHLAGLGVRTIRLEADPPGVRLYRRLGFTDEFESLRFIRPAGRQPTGTEAEQLTRADLPEVAAFDAEYFGDGRLGLLELLFERARLACCVREGATLRGYVFLWPSLWGARIGPWVAEDETAARTLLETALAYATDGDIVVGVPAVNQGEVVLLESLGFNRSLGCLRMVRGPSIGAGRPAGIWGIANGAMG